MPQPCILDPLSGSDTTLIAVCTVFQQHVAAFEIVLNIIDDIGPTEGAGPEFMAAHNVVRELLRSIRTKAHIIQGTGATGAAGRMAKIAALNTYLRTMATPQGDLLEVDLARSVVTDFIQDSC